MKKLNLYTYGTTVHTNKSEIIILFCEQNSIQLRKMPSFLKLFYPIKYMFLGLNEQYIADRLKKHSYYLLLQIP